MNLSTGFSVGSDFFVPEIVLPSCLFALVTHFFNQSDTKLPNKTRVSFFRLIWSLVIFALKRQLSVLQDLYL